MLMFQVTREKYEQHEKSVVQLSNLSSLYFFMCNSFDNSDLFCCSNSQLKMHLNTFTSFESVNVKRNECKERVTFIKFPILFSNINRKLFYFNKKN